MTKSIEIPANLITGPAAEDVGEFHGFDQYVKSEVKPVEAMSQDELCEHLLKNHQGKLSGNGKFQAPSVVPQPEGVSQQPVQMADPQAFRKGPAHWSAQSLQQQLERQRFQQDQDVIIDPEHYQKSLANIQAASQGKSVHQMNAEGEAFIKARDAALAYAQTLGQTFDPTQFEKAYRATKGATAAPPTQSDVTVEPARADPFGGLGDWLEKAKYTKRTGTKGNYRYEYATTPKPATSTQGGDEEPPKPQQRALSLGVPMTPKPKAPAPPKASAKPSAPTKSAKGKKLTDRQLGLLRRAARIGSVVPDTRSAERASYKLLDLGLMRSVGHGILELTDKGKEALQTGSVKKSRVGANDMSDVTDPTSILRDWLSKSMPTHEPKQDQGYGDGSANGGKAAETKAPTGSDPTPDLNPKVVPGLDQQLSDDDEECGDIGEGEVKPIQTTTRKSSAVTPANQREWVAHEHAAVVSRLRKAQNASVSIPTVDDAAAELVKAEDFYHGHSPSLTPPRAASRQSRSCGGCSQTFAKSLTACPHCGAGLVKARPLPTWNETRLKKAKHHRVKDVQIGTVQPIGGIRNSG